MTKYGYLIIIASFFILGCGPKKGTCEHPGQTRCKENRVQLCSPSSRWTEVSDCSVVEPGTWACRSIQGDHSCLPADPPPTSDTTSP